MLTLLREKIEVIRREPDHVRRRYVTVCVVVSMVFIVGIWFLSVEEGVRKTAKDIPAALEEGKSITGGVPSLNNLFEQSAPLRLEEEPVEGNTFFNKELDGREGESEGMPVPEGRKE